MKKLFYVFATIVLVATISSCANRKVTRIDPSETPDISGSWNNTDSRLTAEEMIKQILSAKSVDELLAFQTKNIPVMYAPKEATGIDFGFGSCILEKDSNDKTIIAGCPNFLGFWPFINVCSGYACIIFPKELLSDAKKDVYTSVKNILDAQFTSTCK